MDQTDTAKHHREGGVSTLTPHRPTKRPTKRQEVEVDMDNIDFEMEDPPEFSVHIPDANQTTRVPPTTHQPLPLEFSADEFTFVLPTSDEADAFQMLLDAVNEEDNTPGAEESDSSNAIQTNARPKRQPSRPHLYQSEEEEKKEKDLRKQAPQ